MAEYVNSENEIERRFTELLRPFFENDLFRVIYDPIFPKKDGKTIAWFQVIFAVGPADHAAARLQVLRRYEDLLRVLAPHSDVQASEIIALRARRHVPPQTTPDNPHMFIECAWSGHAVVDMLHNHAFPAWHSYCYSYVNRFDGNDALNVPREAS